jgi:hypothetical protein
LKILRFIIFVSLFTIYTGFCFAQISPGELSSFHSHLEGISNCTQCHILGEKLSNDKCLACHTELKERVSANKGYHSSAEVKGKPCESCHSDHHGKSFQIVKFDATKFNHNLTGFPITGAHSKKTCKDCHIIKNILSPKIKTKKFTYLGLKTNCINCHADYHQKTLSDNCISCHDVNGFKPASKFNHSTAKYQLAGKHTNVACIKCHKIETNNGVKFQKFTGLKFNSCINCHVDVHKNKFGQNCMECHSGESFAVTKGIKSFDHTKTNYKLEGKHLVIDCKLCHKIKYTTPIKHEACSDCHKDYHKNQFAKDGVSPDCKACHNMTSFVNFSYTVEQHNKGAFELNGAHIATPCFDCHKKTDKWAFREIGKKCSDCHKNIHGESISKKYYPDDNCLSCHTVVKWSEINFDHKLTNFNLTGAHSTQTCRKCHFSENTDGTKQQKFANLGTSCTNCHIDKHYKQFDKDGVTDCNRCHENDNWKPVKFNHSNTSFKLDGKHVNVQCQKCHKPKQINGNIYIQYKISGKCESCHS